VSAGGEGGVGGVWFVGVGWWCGAGAWVVEVYDSFAVVWGGWGRVGAGGGGCFVGYDWGVGVVRCGEL